MAIQRPRASLLLLLAFWCGVWGCAPRPNTTPLGLGPLALAEQASAAEKKKPAAAKKPAAPAASAPSAAAEAKSKDDSKDENAESDGPADKSATESKSKSKSKSSDKVVTAFSGLFAGKDVAIYRFSGEPDREELDDKARIRIESESPTQLRIVLINSADGSDLCELSAEAQGNSATLDGAQPCFSSEGEGAIHAELTSGTVVLSGDRLSMDAQGTLSLALGEEELDGDLSYSFKGKRQ